MSLATLAAAVRSYVAKFPNTPQLVTDNVTKAVGWVKNQPWLNDAYALWNQTSFTVNLGSFPELNVSNYTLTKVAGNRNVTYTSNGRTNTFTFQGLLAAAKSRSSVSKDAANRKATEAKAAAAAAKARADEAVAAANAAAAEAERLAAEAEKAVNLF